MGETLQIDDEMTVTLLKGHVERTGRGATEILRDALSQYEPTPREARTTSERLREALAQDQAKVREDAPGLEDLYDEDGLPR